VRNCSLSSQPPSRGLKYCVPLEPYRCSVASMPLLDEGRFLTELNKARALRGGPKPLSSLTRAQLFELNKESGSVWVNMKRCTLPQEHASGNSHERDSLSAQRRCDVAAGEESQQQQEQAAQLQTAQLQLSRAQTRRRRTAGLAKSFAASCARRTASASSAPRCVFALRAMPCPLTPSL
jgi:hypothetical protein